METITIIGLIAAFLTTISLLPQVIRVWKTKSVKDISTGMFTLQCCSVCLWVVYGLLMQDVPIMAANMLVFAQASTILVFKRKYQSPIS
ncbi:MAG: SemiSWEET family sugar transporter [Candidatus Bathyarchaeia archaeon]|jgi:MtN3 and saliva related transmembrane protein